MILKVYLSKTIVFYSYPNSALRRRECLDPGVLSAYATKFGIQNKPEKI